MSKLIYTRAALDEGHGREELVTAFDNALRGLEIEAEKQNVVPVWDTLDLETETVEDVCVTLSGTTRDVWRSLNLRVRGVRPSEVAR